MKKNKLIEILNSIKGNPEIVLWNGYVEDYNHIDSSLIPIRLVKETKEFILSNLKNEYRQHNNTFDIPDDVITRLTELADARYKSQQWAEPNVFVEEHEFKQWYGTKTRVVYTLNPKPRNLVSLGTCKADDIKY